MATKLTKEQRLILTGRVCPYCGKPTVLANGADLPWVAAKGPVYACHDCLAYVGCHPLTTTAMGRLATRELRALRREAHNRFDFIWRNKLKRSRYNAYSWLALRMSLPVDMVHIGYFDERQCRLVIKICDDYISKKMAEQHNN